MSKKSDRFEWECAHELHRQYGHLVCFEHMGGSNSTVSDILVRTNNASFYMEIKEDYSQCCQFVLFPNKTTGAFDFSPGNECTKSDNCDAIITYMNERYDYYSKVSTAPLPIAIDKHILYGLVKDFYPAKYVRYVMTKGEDYIIFPLDRFSHYFDIAAFYRRKKSGSAQPNADSNYEEIRKGLHGYGISGDLTYESIGGKVRCLLHCSQPLDGITIICPRYSYQLKSNPYSQQVKSHQPCIFEVRRLSNTSNPSVICQLSLKRRVQDPDDLTTFIRELSDGGRS